MMLSEPQNEKLNKQPTKKWTRSWLKPARFGLGFLAVALMLLALYQNRAALAAAVSTANWAWLSLAFGLNLAASLVYVAVWESCARRLGATGGYNGIFTALSVAGASRYLPGGIWPVAGLVYYAPQIGLSRAAVPVLGVMAQVVHLLAAGMVIIAGLLLALALHLSGGSALSQNELAAALGLAFALVLALVGLGPRYLRPLLARLNLPAKRFSLWPPLALSLFFWGLNGLRLWVLALAFGPVSWHSLPYLAWTGAVVTLLSTLFLVVPAGLGVVEISLGWLAGLVLAWPQVIALVALNRLLRILNDFLFFGFTCGNRLWQRRKLLKNEEP